MAEIIIVLLRRDGAEGTADWGIGVVDSHVVRVWGRSGEPLSVKVEDLGGRDAAVRHADSLLTAKRSKGSSTGARYDACGWCRFDLDTRRVLSAGVNHFDTVPENPDVDLSMLDRHAPPPAAAPAPRAPRPVPNRQRDGRILWTLASDDPDLVFQLDSQLRRKLGEKVVDLDGFDVEQGFLTGVLRPDAGPKPLLFMLALRELAAKAGAPNLVHLVEAVTQRPIGTYRDEPELVGRYAADGDDALRVAAKLEIATGRVPAVEIGAHGVDYSF